MRGSSARFDKAPGFDKAHWPSSADFELLHESSARLGPVDQATAAAMLDETRAGRMFRGFRGQGPYDIDAAAAAIAAISRFGAATVDTISALEINPLIVHAAGEGATGVDLLIEPVAIE